ncbi:hypothetical protein AL755_08475 [Arthrobacter sp. ERGS1:01]|uniref:hypothetical protein n=1 Tax=Arthrobacter sp. ERGS1:01 TaxID=1704044 RepID=UPI0006B60B87|nr:hypothetical protein [Arthrobacter sp. ERGS1:01]ALE05506.1 hypothetical protein AL755_08475 [Arthrobacter sp. ERGS1:01]
MAFDSTPWFVGGGAQHSPEVARGFAYSATSGLEGISGVTDLRVQAQSVPNGTVRILPGNAVILNRYPGAAGQSYTLQSRTATDVPIAPTGSSGGRTDLVVARVLDPQYEGAAPTDPTAFEYARPFVIQGVPASIKTFKELGLNYPAIALAKVTIPANTATITAAMITGLRRVTQAFKDGDTLVIFPTAENVMPVAGYGSWPLTAAQKPTVSVPVWATSVTIQATVTGVVYTKGTNGTDSKAGARTGFGSSDPSENGIIIQDAEDSGGRYTYSWLGKHLIDASMRDTDQVINLQATRSAGTGNWKIDNQSQIMIRYEFRGGAQ